MAESVVDTVDSDLPFAHSIVNGMVFPDFITQQRMDYLKTYNLRLDDVFVVTYPKSGRVQPVLVGIHTAVARYSCCKVQLQLIQTLIASYPVVSQSRLSR